ncbi:hypothetical protein J8281_12555 [Aquimarina sp. U1-2]|uniref:TolB family protein n=1 Tax=Aquimarina sp. U1-2 TaxID=2823141 RepID=UPI001AECF502|nr:hypothetical protein [Aquimarina sp. U1-2]MBP2833020.1 hypothetical protein [Aquimarina sp. U1-2]
MNYSFLITTLCCLPLFSQPNTEVYLFDIVNTDENIQLTNQRNISNNEGYDNQPSFLTDKEVLFASTRNNQTDIAIFNIEQSKLHWLNKTEGSEYSPTKIPEDTAVSAIRLDKDGTQRLYAYSLKSGTSTVLLKELKVGYHTWFTNHIIVSAVLDGEGMSLVVSNIKEDTNRTIQKKVGRSLHTIPNSNLISFISKENKLWEIKSLDPLTGSTQTIIHTIPGAEDMCWLTNGTILMAKEHVIYAFNPAQDSDWSIFYTFENKQIGNITRMSSNSKSTMLAVVGDLYSAKK